MEDDEGALSAQKMAPALIAVHPLGAALVVAIGAGLRVFDFKNESPVTLEDHTTPCRHGEAIRAAAFSNEGRLFASAGDDKLVKLWDTASWSCLKTVRLQKKVTVVSFSQDSKWLLLADKFGVVFVLPSHLTAEGDEPVRLLAHCCSIITDLKLSPDGEYIITSDRDFKIRVSVFPAAPTKGSHDIWSYCLGHASFVTCLAFVGERNSSQQLLISGSGDATVRLWDYKFGTLLDSFDTHDVAELTDKHGEETPRAVVGVSVSPDGWVVAVIIERFAAVLLLEYDNELKKLKYLQSVFLPEQVSPSSVAFDVHGRLWSVAGAAESAESCDRSVTPEEAAAAESKAQAIAQIAMVHIRLIVTSSTPPSTTADEPRKTCGSYVLCEDDSMPGGEALLQALQGMKADATQVAEAAEAAELAMRKLMSKRQYTNEQRENRKRFRNDKKLEKKNLV